MADNRTSEQSSEPVVSMEGYNDQHTGMARALIVMTHMEASMMAVYRMKVYTIDAMVRRLFESHMRLTSSANETSQS